MFESILHYIFQTTNQMPCYCCLGDIAKQIATLQATISSGTLTKNEKKRMRRSLKRMEQRLEQASGREQTTSSATSGTATAPLQPASVQKNQCATAQPARAPTSAAVQQSPAAKTTTTAWDTSTTTASGTVADMDMADPQMALAQFTSWVSAQLLSFNAGVDTDMFFGILNDCATDGEVFENVSFVLGGGPQTDTFARQFIQRRKGLRHIQTSTSTSTPTKSTPSTAVSTPPASNGAAPWATATPPASVVSASPAWVKPTKTVAAPSVGRRTGWDLPSAAPGSIPLSSLIIEGIQNTKRRTQIYF